jgi:hypothetical protein
VRWSDLIDSDQSRDDLATIIGAVHCPVVIEAPIGNWVSVFLLIALLLMAASLVCLLCNGAPVREPRQWDY